MMKKQRGFTLVEAAIAIGVVAILSGILIPLVLKSIRDARMARVRNDLQVFAAALASQIKDTGRRPMANHGPNNANGNNVQYWGSDGAAVKMPFPAGAGGNVLIDLPIYNNSFAALLSCPLPAAAMPNGDLAHANALFGLGNPRASAEFAYKGPYLSLDMAQKSDPWGRRYMILGYNKIGTDENGPIWIVSAGPEGTISRENAFPDHRGRYGAEWNYAGVSRGNIAIRVN